MPQDVSNNVCEIIICLVVPASSPQLIIYLSNNYHFYIALTHTII